MIRPRVVPTRRQLRVLMVVESNEPVTAAGVAYHLAMTDDAARGVLNRLEGRRLVERTYTGTGGWGGIGFLVTDRGRDALAKMDQEAR